MIDNILAINLVKNPISHERRKHIVIRFHFIKEQFMKRMLEVTYCPIKVQLANGFTKALKTNKFVFLRKY